MNQPALSTMDKLRVYIQSLTVSHCSFPSSKAGLESDQQEYYVEIITAAGDKIQFAGLMHCKKTDFLSIKISSIFQNKIDLLHKIINDSFNIDGMNVSKGLGSAATDYDKYIEVTHYQEKGRKIISLIFEYHDRERDDKYKFLLLIN